MRTLLLLITVSLYAVGVSAQRHAPGINEFRLKLKNEGVDTTVIYGTRCAGGLSAPPTDKKCHPYFTEYLFWRKNGHSFMRRFDECNQYKPRYMNPLFMRIVINNYRAIKKEEIVIPEFEAYEYGIFYAPYKLIIVHTCYSTFYIYTGHKNPLEKDISWFNLNTQFDNKNNKNLNYYKNQNTILNKLKMLAEKHTKFTAANH